MVDGYGNEGDELNPKETEVEFEHRGERSKNSRGINCQTRAEKQSQ